MIRRIPPSDKNFSRIKKLIGVIKSLKNQKLVDILKGMLELTSLKEKIKVDKKALLNVSKALWLKCAHLILAHQIYQTFLNHFTILYPNKK